jgi:hypothetical protein
MGDASAPFYARALFNLFYFVLVELSLDPVQPRLYPPTVFLSYFLAVVQ